MLAAVCHSSQLSQIQKSQVLGDSTRAQVFILSMVAMKTSHYKAMPWRSFGAGHLSVRVAQEVLQETLASDSSHPRVRVLHLSPLREQCLHFITTGQMPENATELHVYLLGSRFPFTAERRVEGLHGRLHT